MKRITGSVLALLVIGGTTTSLSAYAQASKPTAKPTIAQTDKYKEAMAHIKQAKALLRDFLKDNPTGDDAYFAPLQLKALESVGVSPIPIVPVPLYGTVRWRVLSIDPQESFTKVTLEMLNTGERSQGFYNFEDYPLVITANNKVYTLKQKGVQRPPNVNVSGSSWMLLPTQAATIDLYFEALDAGVVEGAVRYANGGSKTPAPFSLLNVNQKPAGK